MANSNFTGYAAYAVANELSQKWTQIWTQAWPFWGMIRGAGRFNNGIRDTTGTKMIVPITDLGPTTTARDATDANQFTPITPNASQGFTQAEYFYATKENAFYMNIVQNNQLKAGKTQLIPVLPGLADQLMFDFVKSFNADMVGTQNGGGRAGNGKVTGEQYFLSASNSPGNESQSTNSDWQAQLYPASGPFGLYLIDNGISAIADTGRGEPDFLQLSYNSNNNVYDKLTGLIGSSQLVTKEADTVHFGFQMFYYKNIKCFRDGRLGDVLQGSMALLSSNTWWLNMETETPVPASENPVMRLNGTTSVEHMYEQTLAVGNSDCARNALYTGIAA